MNNNSGTFILLVLICLTSTTQIYLRAESRQIIITAITDNGCSSHQELIPIVERIDNYNLNSLKAGE